MMPFCPGGDELMRQKDYHIYYHAFGSITVIFPVHLTLNQAVRHPQPLVSHYFVHIIFEQICHDRQGLTCHGNILQSFEACEICFLK